METELKFHTDDAGLTALANQAALGNFRLLDGSHSYDLDTYYDTISHRLQSGGYACRIRLHDGQPIATLKSLGDAEGALHTREEFETYLTKPVPDLRAWPEGPAREIATRLTDGETLHPIVTLEQIRHIRPVLSNGQIIAAMSLDRITAHRNGSSHSWCEIEIEMEEDTPAETIEALADLLRQQRQLQPAGKSKLEQAMQLFIEEKDSASPEVVLSNETSGEPEEVTETTPLKEPKKGPGLEPTDSLPQATNKLLQYYVAEMEKTDKKLDDEISEDTVHQARVSVRRLRSLMRLLPEVFDSRQARRIQRQLRRYAQLLGVVRDLDVGLLKAEKFSETLTEDEKKTILPLLEDWQSERQTGISHLSKYLESKRHHQLVRKLGRLADHHPPEAVSSPIPWQLRHLLPPLLWTQYTRIWAYETVMADPSGDTLHALRIEAKRLRYAFEFFQELLAPEGDKLHELIVALQDHLGALQDARVTIKKVHHYVEDRKALPDSGPDGISNYLQYRVDEENSLKKEFPGIWQAAQGSRFRRVLGKALARL